jgi:hypothetical protein
VLFWPSVVASTLPCVDVARNYEICVPMNWYTSNLLPSGGVGVRGARTPIPATYPRNNGYPTPVMGFHMDLVPTLRWTNVGGCHRHAKVDGGLHGVLYAAGC